MKAVLCRAFGPPETLAVETVDPPAPGPGEVRIAVAAVGVKAWVKTRPMAAGMASALITRTTSAKTI